MSGGRPNTAVVTFFFSDIEGSTRLAQETGDRWEGLLDRHRAVLRAAFEHHRGREVGSEGDSFFAVFADPRDAIAAAIEAQTTLARESEPEGERSPVSVRIGLHAGTATWRGEDYVGVEIHRAARIAAGGHGGQVLVSEPVRSLISDGLPTGLSLQRLGEFRLKDFDSPQTIYQLAAPGLPSRFPPLRLVPVGATNLPVALSSFIGRAREREAVADLIRRSRLVTILGPGGTGKTRLAIEVADRLGPEFSHGVWFVDLSPLTDAALVLPTATAALGVREEPARPLLEVAAEQLADRSLLVLFDNFEQVLTAASTVAELLQRLPQMRILATSREPLHLSGEQEFHLEPMGVATDEDLSAVAQSDAVALFVERAQAVDAGFSLDAETMRAAAQIVRRLDGLPLAIELAAARVKLLAPHELVARLTGGVRVLSAAGPGVPERHRTVESTIDWSYRLLVPAEARFFARVAVFAGGATVETAEAVANPDRELGIETLDGLASLVDKSLLVRAPDRFGSRFRSLETVREYALRRLADDDPVGETSRRHAEQMLALAEEARPLLTMAAQQDRVDRLSAELDNFRAALGWAISTDAAQLAMSLCYALWRFWQLRSHIREGERWCRLALATPSAGGAPFRERVMAKLALGNMLYWQVRGEEAAEAYSSAASGARALGNDDLLAEALFDLTYPLNLAGQVAGAEEAAREALGLYERLGNERGVADVAVTLAGARVQVGDWVAARAYTEDAHRRYEELGDVFWSATTLYGLALLDLTEGEVQRGEERYHRVLEVFDTLGDTMSLYFALHGLAWAAALRGDGVRAARLGGAAARITEEAGAQLPPFLTKVPDPLELAAGLIGEEQGLAEAEIGRRMQHDELIAYARVGQLHPESPPAHSPS
jgi:predicted ATPase/class 3 adenylate cyclase